MADHLQQDNAGSGIKACPPDQTDKKTEDWPLIAPVSDKKLLPDSLLSKLKKYLDT
jgi:hypothetical protein